MATLQIEHKPYNLPSKHNYKVDKNIAIALAVQGKSDREIADYFGILRQSVWELLKPYRARLASFEVFQENKAASFEWLQFRLGRGLTDREINKLKPDKKIAAIEKLEKIIRLDRGEATEIKRVEIAFDLSAFR